MFDFLSLELFTHFFRLKTSSKRENREAKLYIIFMKKERAWRAERARPEWGEVEGG